MDLNLLRRPTVVPDHGCATKPLTDMERGGHVRSHRAGYVNRAAVRELPNGGFAAIDVTVVREGFWRPRYSGALVVERRSDRVRRLGHQPPIVAWSVGGSLQSVVRKLLPMMRDDARLGRLASGYVTRRISLVSGV